MFPAKKQLLKNFNWLVLAIILDQAIKQAIIFLWPSLIYKNFGLIFSIQAPAWLILAISIVFITIFIAFFINKQIPGAILIVAGGLSNLLDRLTYGYVVDYINIHTAYFNLADIFILVGILWIAFHKSPPSQENLFDSQSKNQ